MLPGWLRIISRMSGALRSSHGQSNDIHVERLMEFLSCQPSFTIAKDRDYMRLQSMAYNPSDMRTLPNLKDSKGNYSIVGGMAWALNLRLPKCIPKRCPANPSCQTAIQMANSNSSTALLIQPSLQKRSPLRSGLMAKSEMDVVPTMPLLATKSLVEKRAKLRKAARQTQPLSSHNAEPVVSLQLL